MSIREGSMKKSRQGMRYPTGTGNQQFLNKRISSSKMTVRNTQGARSIQLKPDLVMQRNKSTAKLVPALKSQRNQSLQMRNVASERRLPDLNKHNKQTIQPAHGGLLPSLRKSISRRTLAGSSLSRVYSNPQFSNLNQAPYFRPKTSAFGYQDPNNFRKDPTKKAPWTSEQVGSITGIKTMTSLAPGNAKFQKDKLESSPAKRTLSKQGRRKKTSHKTHRQTLQTPGMVDKRPNTSYLLQSAAERMAWPKKPTGREKLNPKTPVKAFTFRSDKESQFLHSDKDIRMSLENFPYENNYVKEEFPEKIEEFEEFERASMDGEDVETFQKMEKAMSSGSNFNQIAQKTKIQKSNSKRPTIDEVITVLQNDPKDEGQYFYLISTDEKKPYDLQPLLELEDHKKLEDYTKFYTLSKKGITTYVNDEPVEFITLNDWLKDKEKYEKIKKKTYFEKFDRWKILRMWRMKICIKKRETVTEILQDKLFILHDEFSQVLLKLKDSC